MPSIRNIDKFVQLFNSLGDEPKILKGRGLSLEPAVVPEKNSGDANPFLVNIDEKKEEDDNLEAPDLTADLESFDDDFDHDGDDGVPDLEIDDDFSLDDISPDIDDVDAPGDLESIDDLDIEPEFDDLDNLDELDDLDDLDIESEEEDLDSSDGIETGIDILNNPIANDDISEFDELEELTDELGELNDEDLDTTLESLDDGIEDIDIEDIDIEEDLDSIAPDLDVLSIEDEVLEDDFGSLEDDDSDEFSLGDFGDSFNFDTESSSSALTLEEFSESEEDEPVEEETKYTQEEFESIKKTLFSLPLNLKVAIEEEIAENGLFGIKLEGLVILLIEDAPVKDIVKYVNSKLGHKIKVSSSFAKMTALDFEKQKDKFLYIFINNVLPKLKWVFPIAVLLALVYLAGYFWGYKIFKSENIYKEGYELILVDRYEDAYDKFMEAFNTHRKTKWYYIYSDTYYDRKAFNYAEKIYLQIINENSTDQFAILSYSKMKGFDQGEYAKATNFLVGYIDEGMRNYEIMTTVGDLYMKWAEIDPDKYDDARLWYAETMNKFGPKPGILFKYLNYFIKTDNLNEVQSYRRMFEISKGVKVDGDLYARMGGYLMDKGIVENVRKTLFRGIKENPRNPNLHYQLARYFDSIGNNREVEKAARNAIFYYEYGGFLSEEELSSLVDVKRMLGDLYSEEERYIAAEKNFQEAVSLYENLQERNFVHKESKYGRIYSGYGDIFYYAGNSFSSAYNLYTKAEDNGYKTSEISYKKGYIDYHENHMEAALSEFHSAEDIRVSRESIMFAKANTLSYRGSYNSALTYYNMHLRYLQKMEEDEEILYPAENESHLAIIENYIRVYNNIGVTTYKLYGDKALSEVGMAFTKSTEYYDYLTRDPDFLIRSGLKDLAYYNTRAILYPEKETELFLYNTISMDFKDLNLGIVTALE